MSRPLTKKRSSTECHMLIRHIQSAQTVSPLQGFSYALVLTPANKCFFPLLFLTFPTHTCFICSSGLFKLQSHISNSTTHFHMNSPPGPQMQTPTYQPAPSSLLLITQASYLIIIFYSSLSFPLCLSPHPINCFFLSNALQQHFSNPIAAPGLCLHSLTKTLVTFPY